MADRKNMSDELIDRIIKKKNPCIVGLDPRMDLIPESIIKDETAFQNPYEAVRETIKGFNKSIIESIKEIVPAVKPQIAFYEQYGSEGVKAYEWTVKFAQENGLLVIGDAKRNDIGTTAKAYAYGHLGRVSFPNKTSNPSYNVDMMTVNGYLGSDGIKPFIEACKEFQKGIFVLVKTSNPSSGELQDKKVSDGSTVYETMASMVARLGEELKGDRGYSSIGAVVGATYPKEADKLRNIMPSNIFLVPGYGAQGGTADDVIPCFNKDGYGAIVNSSRGIIYAYDRDPYMSRYEPREFHLASKEAAMDMRDDIVNALKRNNKMPDW
jgi:orotidine-5'-phosphate decarboxylase